MIDSDDSAYCAPTSIPANRLDLELAAIDKWQEAVNLRQHAQRLMLAVPRPPRDEGVMLALESVEDFRLQLASTADSATARPLRVAAEAATIILNNSCEEAGLTGITAAAKAFRADGNATSQAILSQVRDTQPDEAPGEGVPPVLLPTGAPWILHHLAAVQMAASAIVGRSVSTMPFISCCLDENMIADRHEHEIFFKSADVISKAYDRLFKDKRGDIKSLWGSHVNSAGRFSHPARMGEDAHYFDGPRWLGSVTSSRDVLKMGVPHPEHPLPDTQTLLLCFKAQQAAQNTTHGKRSRASEREEKHYNIDKDVVGAIALLMGDIVYKVSLHLGEVLPALACGPLQLIPGCDLQHRVLTLGLFFQYAINYQSYALKSTFKLFDVSELHFCFSMPATNSPDLRKAVTFHYDHKDLGIKRWAALPFLITCLGLRNYRIFQKDPDEFLANLRSPAASFIDEISGVISMAKEKVQRKTPSSVPDHDNITCSMEAGPSAPLSNQPLPMVILDLLHFYFSTGM